MRKSNYVVLFVDDEEDWIDLGSLALIRAAKELTLGDRVKLFPRRSAEEAQKFLDTFIPDLIISDVRLPGYGGIELLKTLKSTPQYCVIPVAMLSSSDLAADVQSAYRAGAAVYLQKPSSLRSLTEYFTALYKVYFLLAQLPHYERRP